MPSSAKVFQAHGGGRGEHESIEARRVLAEDRGPRIWVVGGVGARVTLRAVSLAGEADQQSAEAGAELDYALRLEMAHHCVEQLRVDALVVEVVEVEDARFRHALVRRVDLRDVGGELLLEKARGRFEIEAAARQAAAPRPDVGRQ